VFELDCSGGPFLVAKQQGALHALLDADRQCEDALLCCKTREAGEPRPSLDQDFERTLRAEDEHREGAVPRQSPCSLFLSEETQLAVVSIEQQQRRRVGARRIEEELKAPSGNSFDLELGTEVANRGVGAIELRYPLTELVRHLPEGLIQAGDLVLPWQRRDPDPQFAPCDLPRHALETFDRSRDPLGQRPGQEEADEEQQADDGDEEAPDRHGIRIDRQRGRLRAAGDPEHGDVLARWIAQQLVGSKALRGLFEAMDQGARTRPERFHQLASLSRGARVEPLPGLALLEAESVAIQVVNPRLGVDGPPR
jgi:hypothetical protein